MKVARVCNMKIVENKLFAFSLITSIRGFLKAAVQTTRMHPFISPDAAVCLPEKK